MIDDYATIEEYVRKAMGESQGYVHVTQRLTRAETRVRELESLAKNRLGQIRHLNKGLRNQHLGYKKMQSLIWEVMTGNIEAKKKLAVANEDNAVLRTALRTVSISYSFDVSEGGNGHRHGALVWQGHCLRCKGRWDGDEGGSVRLDRPALSESHTTDCLAAETRKQEPKPEPR